MTVQDKKAGTVENNKVGAILGIIGSSILTIVGLYTLLTRGTPIMAYNEMIRPIDAYLKVGAVTTILGTCGIVASRLVFKIKLVKNRLWGYIFLLIVGIVGIYGASTPTYRIVIGYDRPVPVIEYAGLNQTAFYFDLVLMVLGGILGIAMVISEIIKKRK